MKRIGVMVVDDSAVVRQALVGILQQDPGLEVIAAVADPIFAMSRMKERWPDVLVLDVEMMMVHAV
jgi:two-component system chemotaxis response regulator CheB